MKAEIGRVVEESSRKLLQISTPPVKYWLLSDVLRKSPDDRMLQQTIKECETYLPRLRLLRALREDGTWPIARQRELAEERGPGPPIGWTYTTMLRNLYALGDYVTSKEEGNVRAALERILSWQSEDGHIPGPTTTAFPEPHYNGFALRDLNQFRMDRDPRTYRLEQWLIRMQRPDGGWSIPYVQDVRYLPEYKHMRMKDFMALIQSDDRPSHDPKEHEHIPSCVWSTLAVLRGFCWSPSMRHQKEMKRGADFVLDRIFKRNYHASFYLSEKNWTTLKYPLYFGSGLSALEVLTMMGHGSEDERMEEGVRWLLKVRSKDGFWYRSDRPSPDQDQWITLVVLCTLVRYAGMYGY
ncbi:MAG: prenyltransferase/squalene oxidase repeat-containing protein [Thermoplasmata archaeon]